MPQLILYALPAPSKKRIMAQTLPPSPDPSSPLPRYERKRAAAVKAPRPRFQAADAALAVLFSGASFALSAALHSGHTGAILAALLSALTAGMTYLLGWRCGGRTCGIIAGSLTAFSLSFAQMTSSWSTALFVLLIVTALFAFACDATIAACALTGFAAAARPDGTLLGLLLLTLVAVRTRRQFLPGLGALLVAALAGGTLRVFGLHALFPTPALYATGGAVFWLLEPAQLWTVWLLIPLCAELTDPARRLRWLPIALWGILYLALTFFVHFGGSDDMLLPLMPVLFVLAAGGLARLMPSLAGELPAARYALATLAIVGLLFLRMHVEWTQHSAELRPAAAAIVPTPQPSPAMHTPTVPPQVTPTMRVVPYPARLVRKVKPRPPSVVRRPLAVLPIAKKPTTKPAVALYTLRNGRLVHRTKWAIQWDLTHPKTKP